MAKEFFLTKWIRGWHLERLFQHSPNGDISVKDAATKTIGVIDETLVFWTQYEPLFDSVVSDNAQASADDVKDLLTEIKGQLEIIETLPDIAETLQNYRFAEDDKRNDFYHSLVSTAALAFNDGKISLFEAISFVAQIAIFVKETA